MFEEVSNAGSVLSAGRKGDTAVQRNLGEVGGQRSWGGRHGQERGACEEAKSRRAKRAASTPAVGYRCVFPGRPALFALECESQSLGESDEGCGLYHPFTT